ncbi:d3dd181f-d55c-413a-856f-d56b3ad424f7-CDS [Sclerotinia trifoliorum]|uniref:D3dd181f-d55c-413a-856f-d56b3ad424f7-CDS n=1 Tax=Sclerotinia trifoliorum TaxID=28548 RepID=A0A8H2VSF6_9HELO|nr:d3dd181f-d55c-413a-856f-d56b3ad424f7-CDS [Sclerotinia trifoliorum]
MIKDNFPLAMSARSAADLPPVPPWNKPPVPHVKENTPLFIAFTRNWLLLQQTVVSWITSGWPAEDIYVVENTGTMRSNELGLLSLQNPFFLNHTRLHMLGVNVIVTPTIYTFAQLQNFFLWTAIEKDLETYFWSHMDIIPITFEQGISASNGYAGHQTIYQHAVEVLRSAQSADPDPNASDPSKPWAMRFFAFDYLALVNRAAFESVGGFDTTIPFYHTDCDMYARLLMAGYGVNEPRHLMTTFGNDFAGTDKFGSGIIYDIAHSIDDLIVLYRKKSTVEASFTGETTSKDDEAGRKHGGEQSITVKQAHEQEEAHRKVEGNQKQAATDDDDAQAYTKAMEEQVPFGNKAEAQNEGYIKATPKADVDTSDSDVQQASKIHQGWQGAKDAGGKEPSPMVAKDLSQAGSSVTMSEAGGYKSEAWEIPKNPQFKSLEGLHRDATAKKSTTLFSSTSLDSNSKWVTDEPGSPAYFHLLQVATNMVLAKYSQGAEGRNEWQHLQPGGKDEPYYRHAEGFEKALQLTIEMGRRVYLEKWGTLDCELIQGGFTLDDEWKPEEGSELV